MKKIAEDFNFDKENSSNHIAYDVVRPSECFRDIVKKNNHPDYEDSEFPPDSISIGKEHRAELILFKKGN